MHIIKNAKLKDATLKLCNSQQLFASQHALTLLQLESSHCHAIISLQGAQLLQFTPKRAKPWLYIDPDNQFVPGDAIAGGIPLCLPWFGRHHQCDYPIHGYGQNVEWQLCDITQQAQSICFDFSYQHEPTQQFPFRFLACHRICLGADIHLQLIVYNQSAQAFPLSFAWHSYFNLDKSKACQLNGLQQEFYLDNLQQLEVKQQTGRIDFSQAIDAVFEQAPTTQTLYTGQQQLLIEGEHCPTCIVWQPNGSSPFACVERGFAFDDSIQLAPNQGISCNMSIKETNEWL